MGIFDFFKQEDEATKIRKKVRRMFDNVVKDTVQGCDIKEPMILGVLVQSAIAELYKNLKEERNAENICRRLGVNYQQIVEEECKNALSKYLE